MTTNVIKNNIKCAVFDLDGTLLNTIETIKYYLNLALSENGFDAISTESCRAFVGDGAVKLVSRALHSLGAYSEENFQAVYRDYNLAYNADPYYLTEIYGGISQMLSDLKMRGVRLLVLSNKPDYATRATVEKFFPHTFDLIYGAREGVSLKPSPEPLLSMLSEINLTSGDCAYIGDSEPDVLLAANAGVALPIAVSWGFRTEGQLRDAGAEIITRDPGKVVSLICEFI